MTTNADWEATVAQWTSVYREVYDDQSTSRFAGWIDYVTGRRIPDAVMEAWLDWSVRSVRRLHPRAVLEIGGGTGMIADGLADIVDRYVLTDPVTGGDAHPHPAVTSKLAGAHELARVLDDADRFDCVVVNSVIQHFPDVDYLAHVLTGVVPHLTDDANIYLGDLRHAGLHRAQCRERARVREPFATPDRIDDLAAQFIRSDPELLVSPRDIARAASGLPGPWHPEGAPARLRRRLGPRSPPLRRRAHTP
ncbi:methyltransferase domain-containing protein [Gordonia humi]|uniref:methyltransferase domain-containing protein n=1 Tax=Gordonia humi TaxID=686429 RepID=UPI00361ABAFF